MKITCNREQFLSAFQAAAAVASSRTTKPILQNVKLECTKDSVIVMATDLEIGIRVAVSGVDVISTGSVALPASSFGAFLRGASGEDLAIEESGKVILAQSGKGKFRLPSQNPDEFPSLPTFDQNDFYAIQARLLREAIRRTAFATDDGSRAMAMSGVLMEFASGSIDAAATDGRRLAVMSGDANCKSSTKASSPILPSKALRLIERSLSDTDAEVQVAVRDNDVLVQSPRLTIYTRLVEGRFPKWRDVFPKRTDAVKIELAVGPFYSCVRQAAIASNEMSLGVNFKFGGGIATMSAKAKELGETHAEMPIAYDGSEVDVCLDPRFMNDFLKVLDPEKVFTLEIKDAESAVVCHTDDGYSYVIMPLLK